MPKERRVESSPLPILGVGVVLKEPLVETMVVTSSKQLPQSNPIQSIPSWYNHQAWTRWRPLNTLKYYSAFYWFSREMKSLGQRERVAEFHFHITQGSDMKRVCSRLLRILNCFFHILQNRVLEKCRSHVNSLQESQNNSNNNLTAPAHSQFRCPILPHLECEIMVCNGILFSVLCCCCCCFFF